jgi:hypothetical protein
MVMGCEVWCFESSGARSSQLTDSLLMIRMPLLRVSCMCFTFNSDLVDIAVHEMLQMRVCLSHGVGVFELVKCNATMLVVLTFIRGPLGQTPQVLLPEASTSVIRSLQKNILFTDVTLFCIILET